MVNDGAFVNSRGYSMIEVMIAIGLVGLVAMGVSSMIAFYSSRITEIRTEQELRTDVGNILKTFASTDSCNRHLKTVMGPLPATLSGLDYYFDEVEFMGGIVKPGAPVPGRPYSLLGPIRLHIEGVPLPGQMIARGLIKIDYKRLKPNMVEIPWRSRAQSVFLQLNPAGRVASCLDDRSYRQIELTQQICSRFGGDWTTDFKCDMSGSSMARKAGCKALGLDFAGDLCVR